MSTSVIDCNLELSRVFVCCTDKFYKIWCFSIIGGVTTGNSTDYAIFLPPLISASVLDSLLDISHVTASTITDSVSSPLI